MPPRPSGHAWRARLIDLVRYAAVSAISTTVGLTSLALLVVVGHWPAGWANLVGTGLGTIPSFELNRRWVWRRNDRRSLSREVVPFCLLCLVELVASSLAVHAVAGWTARQGWPERRAHRHRPPGQRGHLRRPVGGPVRRAWTAPCSPGAPGATSSARR